VAFVLLTGSASTAAAETDETADRSSAQASDEELAKQTQNPLAKLISLPFQYNATFDVGPDKGTLSVLNIQPVIPFSLNSDWNVITRTIVPIINQPPLTSGSVGANGIGDTQFTAFLSPANSGKTIWGVGGVVQIPTNTNSLLGSNEWGLGASAVALRMDGPWVYGALINNIWSLGASGSQSYNQMLLQPFVNYNFKGGFYLTSSPIITANWKADSSNAWTVPIGGGVGQIIRIGKLPVNGQVQVYYNVVRPDGIGEWAARLQVQLLFPE
jgi:hypothetical protein